MEPRRPANIQKILFKTAVMVFKDAAFMLLEPSGNAARREADRLTGFVTFSGPFSGMLTMSVDEPLAFVAGANMLGVDEDDESGVVKSADAAMELLNMLCGNLLPALAGARLEFTIEAPELVSNARHEELTALQAELEAARIEFSHNGRGLELSLFLDRKAAEQALGAATHD